MDADPYRVEFIFRLIWPYVKEMISCILTERVDLASAELGALLEAVCFRAETTVRRMVKELNEKVRSGDLEELAELRKLIRENPEVAVRASKYVAKRIRWRVRRLIAEELAKLNGQATAYRVSGGGLSEEG